MKPSFWSRVRNYIIKMIKLSIARAIIWILYGIYNFELPCRKKRGAPRIQRESASPRRSTLQGEKVRVGANSDIGRKGKGLVWNREKIFRTRSNIATTQASVNCFPSISKFQRNHIVDVKIHLNYRTIRKRGGLCGFNVFSAVVGEGVGVSF